MVIFVQSIDLMFAINAVDIAETDSPRGRGRGRERVLSGRG
jgi:hypothetical protein